MKLSNPFRRSEPGRHRANTRPTEAPAAPESEEPKEPVKPKADKANPNLAEFRIVFSDRYGSPTGWVTVFAVDKDRARRAAATQLDTITKALLLFGPVAMKIHAGPFDEKDDKKWKTRYILGEVGRLTLVPAVRVAA